MKITKYVAKQTLLTNLLKPTKNLTAVTFALLVNYAMNRWRELHHILLRWNTMIGHISIAKQPDSIGPNGYITDCSFCLVCVCVRSKRSKSHVATYLGSIGRSSALTSVWGWRPDGFPHGAWPSDRNQTVKALKTNKTKKTIIQQLLILLVWDRYTATGVKQLLYLVKLWTEWNTRTGC